MVSVETIIEITQILLAFSSPCDYDTNPAKRLNEQKIHCRSPMDSHLI
jgi:hypothetical protein